MKTTTSSAGGTSFHGTTLLATANQLKSVLGEADFYDNDGKDKVNFEWDLVNDAGQIFTVYDWKEYRPIGLDEMIEWHLGGFSLQSTELGKEEILTALKTVTA